MLEMERGWKGPHTPMQGAANDNKGALIGHGYGRDYMSAKDRPADPLEFSEKGGKPTFVVVASAGTLERLIRTPPQTRQLSAIIIIDVSVTGDDRLQGVHPVLCDVEILKCRAEP
jgi:hypothetical protein